MKSSLLLLLPLVTASAGDQLPCLVLTDRMELVSSLTALKTALKANCPSELTVKSLWDKSVQLNRFGVDFFSNVVILIENGNKFKFPFTEDPAYLVDPPTYRQGNGEVIAAKYNEMRRAGNEGISQFDMTRFADAGRNILVAVKGGSGASSELIQFLKEFGMTLPGAKSVVVDYFAKNQTIATSVALKSEPWTQMICGSKPVNISGSPIALSGTNKNVFALLRAGETSFHPAAPSQGFGIVLAAANQALNGARFTLITSTSVFETNEEFAKNLVSWTLGNRGLLRARDLYHHKVGETTAPRMYKEKDDIEVGLVIEHLVDGQWLPFPASDVQIEFVMLDPYIRQFLEFTGTKHKLVFKAPDVYGIFKFKVDYKRRGYNPIFVEQVAPVRNPWHNDYPRFLPCAYPYYASCFMTLGLVIIFAAVFLNHKESERKTSSASGVAKEARHRS